MDKLQIHLCLNIGVKLVKTVVSVRPWGFCSCFNVGQATPVRKVTKCCSKLSPADIWSTLCVRTRANILTKLSVVEEPARSFFLSFSLSSVTRTNTGCETLVFAVSEVLKDSGATSDGAVFTGTVRELSHSSSPLPTGVFLGGCAGLHYADASLDVSRSNLCAPRCSCLINPRPERGWN